MFSSDADLFFTNPATPPPASGQFGVLYLLRRDVLQCLGVDPATGKTVGERILLPGAMSIMAGIDLLAKFHSGTDDGGVALRFKGFLEAYFGLASPADAETLYQLRCALLHSFGLYARSRSREYHFYITRDDDGELLASVGEYHAVDLPVLHRKFEQSVELYRRALDSAPALQQNFQAMFPRYGSLRIG